MGFAAVGEGVDAEEAGMWGLGEGFVGRGVWRVGNANRMNKINGGCGEMGGGWKAEKGVGK